MKTALIVVLAMLLFLVFFHLALAETDRIAIDLDNDRNMDEIVISKENIEILRKSKGNNAHLKHVFTYEPRKVSMFNLHNLADNYLGLFDEQDQGRVISLKQKAEDTRFSIINSSFSKEKFIITDINRDGLYDFIEIKEPTSDNSNLYKQVIYYQGKDYLFLNKPDKTIKTKRSSFITGLYYDINSDGLLDKIEIRYKHYGAFLADIKCIIYLYLLRGDSEQYSEQPDIRIIASGMFYSDINFRDIDKDGYPDIVILDIPKKPKSLQDAITKLIERRADITLKFYLYNKKAKGYPLAPTFEQKINIDILKDFNISLDYDFNSDGYRDLLITQANHSERYLFEPKRCIFKAP
jgi:hypothetical protein